MTFVWVGTSRFMDAPVDRAPIEMEEGEPAESESSSKEMKASKIELVTVGCFLIGSTKQKTQNRGGGGSCWYQSKCSHWHWWPLTSKQKSFWGYQKTAHFSTNVNLKKIEAAGRNSYNRGLRLWRSKNFAEAAQCFRSAALNGHSTGAYALGVMLLNGHFGELMWVR